MEISVVVYRPQRLMCTQPGVLGGHSTRMMTTPIISPRVQNDIQMTTQMRNLTNSSRIYSPTLMS